MLPNPGSPLVRFVEAFNLPAGVHWEHFPRFGFCPWVCRPRGHSSAAFSQLDWLRASGNAELLARQLHGGVVRLYWRGQQRELCHSQRENQTLGDRCGARRSLPRLGMCCFFFFYSLCLGKLPVRVRWKSSASSSFTAAPACLDVGRGGTCGARGLLEMSWPGQGALYRGAPSPLGCLCLATPLPPTRLFMPGALNIFGQGVSQSCCSLGTLSFLLLTNC